jgi:type II secretory ATPase GspE/PulE/Tfp pilus assembly ATPase PilB-like protein
MMRQDPDVILVGEIRDKETAEMAFRAAMTGHQVYSTLHTNSAVGAIPRLLDIGVLPDIMAGNIIGVVAQRLVRKLCSRCKTRYQPDAFERRLLGLPPDSPVELFRAQGCEACDHQGYRGRISVLEILKLDAELDELIARRATARELRRSALERGFRPLADDAVRRVIEGLTSLDEIARVVDLTDRI